MFSQIDNKDLLLLQMLKEGSPSIEEMRQAILVRSTGTVANRLKNLEEQGYVIQPADHQHRSRTITTSGIEVLKGAGLLDDESL